jgi:hypothetical protein
MTYSFVQLSMFRFLFRLFGFLFLGASFVVLIYDGTRSIADSALIYAKLTEIWAPIHVASLQQFQLVIQETATPSVKAVATTVLDAPAFVVFGVIGAILVPLGARSSRLSRYSAPAAKL